jgi:hypothetical protein
MGLPPNRLGISRGKRSKKKCERSSRKLRDLLVDLETDIPLAVYLR